MPLVPLNSAEAQQYLQQNPAANAYVSNYLKNVSLPEAQNTTAQAGADVASNTVQTDISKKVADTSLSVLQAQQAQDQINAIKDLSTKRGKDKFVSPQDYDKAKTAYANAGGDATKFDQEMGGLRNPLNPNYILTDPSANRIQENTSAAIRAYNQFKNSDFKSLGVGSQDAANVFAIKSQIDQGGSSSPAGVLGLIDKLTGSSFGAKTESSLSPSQNKLYKLQQDLDVFYTNMVATLNSRGLTPTDAQQLKSLKPNIYDSPDILNSKINSMLNMVGNTATVLNQSGQNNQISGRKPSLDDLYNGQ